MKCNQCGTEFEGKFCPECGAAAPQQTTINPAAEVAPQAPSHTEQRTAQAQSQTQQPAQPQPAQQAPNTSAYPQMNNSGKQKKPKKPFYKRVWFYVVIVLAAAIILGSVFGNKKDGGEKIEWSKIELSAQLPEMPFEKGKISTNTDEELSIKIEKVSEDDFKSYMKECAAKGYSVDAEKTQSSYEAYNAAGYHLDIYLIGDSFSLSLKAPIKFGSIAWPTSELGFSVPEPKSSEGKFEYEYEEHFLVYVKIADKAEYEDYIDSCSAYGLDKNYDKGDTYYRADDENGYHISVSYEGNNIMKIEASSPEKDEPATAAPVTDTEEKTDSVTAEQNTAVSSAEPETKKTDSSPSGLRSDFKEAMDSYEKFIDEYVAFMKKYKANPGDISLLADYTSFISRLTDVTEKFDKWESSGLSAAELTYYLEVQSRASKKLADAAIN